MKNKTSVLLCDQHTLFRAGINAILREEPSIEIVGEAANGREAVNKAQVLRPDIILIDAAMPELSGCEAIGRILTTNPGAKIIVLTAYEEDEVVTRCLKAGASGYLLKDASLVDLIDAIKAIRRGGQYVSSRVLERIRRQRVEGARSGVTDYDRLSGREREVLGLVAEGLSLKEIATRLVLSVKTIDCHKTNMMRKLNLHDRTEVVKYAIRRNLIRIPSVPHKILAA